MGPLFVILGWLIIVATFDTTDEGATPDFEALQALVPLRSAADFPGRPRTLFDGLLWCVLWLMPPFWLARRWWTPRTQPGTSARITHAA